CRGRSRTSRGGWGMRWYFKVGIAVALGIAVLQLASGNAQQPLGGVGGLAGKGQTDPLTLLRNTSVKKELRLTDEQLEKVNDAVWKALAEALDDEQLARLKQIDLQVRDYRAFADKSVQKQLKLSDEQRENIKAILADADKEMVELRKELNTSGAQAALERIQALSKETKDRCNGVLTNQQRRIWQEMLGDEFKIEYPKLPDPKDNKDTTKKKKKAG